MATPTLSELLRGETRFGRLTVVGEGQVYVQPNGKRIRRAQCRCDCGMEHQATVISLRRGRTRSCGCLVVDVTVARSQTHGDTLNRTPTPEYQAWCSMIGRCYRPSTVSYPLYGGRGISICDRWRGSFEAFLEDVGRRPGPGYSIDRIEVDGNYEPGNVRWATKSEQAGNRRSSRVIQFGGERLCLTELARRYGFKRGTLQARLKRGMPLGLALMRPGSP